MSTLVTILHVVVCLFLMLTVLLQQGKGGMGGAFGGSNAGSVFGGSGASGFLRKLTAVAAAVFMLTSMTLAFLATDDAGDALQKISKSEAARKKREREAQRKLLEGATGGTATPGDGAATGTGDETGAGATAPTGPVMDDGDQGEGAEAITPELPTELVPPSDTPPATGAPPTGTAPATGPATTQPAPGAQPAAPATPPAAPATPPAAPATPPAAPATP